MTIKYKDLSNAIRFLSIDAVEKAKSGHPGLPMGMADVVTVLFKNFLNFNPKNPSWLNRDRFVLSAGHGSMLLYSSLYLSGYKSISLKDIQNFRQLNSICAGHPEYEKNSGIETTTGPLGQGISNAVGFAIAEEILRSRYGKKMFNHKTYVLSGDGCLMEGISHEALSLAGHLKLKNLILLFDNNSISIDGPTSLAVSDDFEKRFQSYGWNYISINGHNEKQIFKSLRKAQKSKKPTIISCKTKIGYGSPNKAGTASAHGSPLGDKEVKLVRKKLNWSHKPFFIPKDILNEWREIGKKGEKIENKWKKINKNKIKNFYKQINLGNLITKEKEKFIKNQTAIATRKSSEKFLELIDLKNLIGGSADLTGSNNTKTINHKIIKSGNFKGNYIHYGVREHAMAGIMNGIALHGNLIPYGGTFLVFSDYLRPSLRLSSLMKQRVIYVLTHDSIGLGEDGPTHQPVEHLASLRAIPNLLVFRPADAIETAECWALAIHSKNSPSIIALTRQNLETLQNEFDEKNNCKYGAYELSDSNQEAKVSILASGSEVNLAMKAKEILDKEKIYTRVVSFPCHELFDLQSEAYKKEILRPGTKKIAIEAGIRMSWDKYLGKDDHFIGIETFGESAPGQVLYDHFNINVNKILSIARDKT